MKKKDLLEKLKAGRTINSLLPLTTDDDSLYFKAPRFCVGDTVIYMPDLEWNGIIPDQPMEAGDESVMEQMLYTGDDFLALCDGQQEAAKRLFASCYWQHPIDVLPDLGSPMAG